MISIQELGVEILSKKPRNFYVWIGPEYGIKERYLTILKEHYGDMKSVDSMADILNVMRTKRLIPLDPCLYVVRYDDVFLSSLNDKTEAEILRTKIVGTVVCIYEANKAATKVLKYLPNCTTSIEHVDPKFIQKYLKQEFPKVCDNFLQFAANHAVNYNHARNMTRCASLIDQVELAELSSAEMQSLFAIESSFDDQQFSQAFMQKNFSRLYSLYEHHTGSVDELIYAMLRSLVELEKLKVKNRTDIVYVKWWILEDIYNMFTHCYAAIKSIRSVSVDPTNILIYLFGLLQFSKIPAKEEIVWS